MSATVSSPQCTQPGSTKCPIFGMEKVTVASAKTAGPSTAPVSAWTPLGMSADTTFACARLMRSAAAAAFPAMMPLNPVPYIASTMTPYESRGISPPSSKSQSAPPKLESRFSISAQSRDSFPRSPTSTTRTSNPMRRSSAAAPTPSPPLLPWPQKTRALFLLPASCAAFCASAFDAFSISVIEGMPYSRIARSSASFMLLPSASSMPFFLPSAPAKVSPETPPNRLRYFHCTDCA